MTVQEATKNLQPGTEMYYSGDMANMEYFGKITRLYNDRWGYFVDLKTDEGEVHEGISISSFSVKYLGHGGTRFVMRKAYKAYREEILKR